MRYLTGFEIRAANLYSLPSANLTSASKIDHHSTSVHLHQNPKSFPNLKPKEVTTYVKNT